MARNNPVQVPNLLERIDALERDLEAQLLDYVAADKAMAPGIPEPVLRGLLLKGSSNFFGAMRRLIQEREGAQ